MKTLLLISCLSTIALAQLRCKNCNGVPSMAECNQVVTCAAGESCYTRKLTTLTGQVLFESGCISQQVCSILGTLGKRSNAPTLTNCYECCTGDNCNVDLCGQHDNSGRTCYACADVLKPSDCPTTTTCPSGQVCFTHSIKSDSIHKLNKFELGCQTKSFCNALAHAPDQNGCNQCCDRDYCNIGTCGLKNLLPPIITHYPNNKTAVIGQPVSLQCTVEKDTNPTLQWTFLSKSGSTVIPSGVQFSSDNTTLNFTASMDTFGNWTCVAINLAGRSTATSFVKQDPALTTLQPTTTTPLPSTTPKPTTTTPKPTTTTPKPTTTTTPKPTTTTPKPTTTTPKPSTTTPKPTTTTPRPTTITSQRPITADPFACQDIDSRCGEFNFVLSVCSDVSQVHLCRKTCRVCSPVATAPTTPTVTTTPLPVTTAAPTTVDPCVDTDSRCATDFQYAFTICSDSINYTRCRKTCRVCSPVATAPTTPTVTTTPLPVTTAAPTTVDPCVDTDSRCATDFQYAFTICSDSINYTRCRKTCRVCSPVATAPTTPTVTTTPLPVTTAVPTTVDPCVDTDSRCATDFQYAFTICSDSINYTRCRKTCRVCSPVATAPTTPTVTTTPLPVTTAAPTTVDPCVDTDSRCATDFQYAFTICSDSINYTRCRKTCRICSPAATAPTTPTVTTTPLPDTTAAPTTVDPCVDTDSRCATDFQYAFTICSDSINYTRCRKTCRVCSPVATAPTTPTVTTTPLPVTTAAPTTVGPCVDTDSRCATDFQYAFTICNDSINYTRCRKTCRVCSPVATAPTIPTVTTTPLPVTTAAPTTVGPCVDTDSRCATDFQYAFTICSDSINYTRCRKTCRVCSPVATAPTTPTVTTTPLPVTTAAPTTVDPCVDTDSRCATDFQYAFTICSDSINYTRCRKTCRVCSSVATAPTTPTVTTTPLPVTTAVPTTVDPCVDTDSRCATDFQYAFTICSDSINYTRCRKTCRVCSPVATAPTTPTVTTTPLPVTTAAPTTVDPCVDTDSRCATDFQYAFTICSDSINYTRCRKTCRVCSPAATAPTTPTVTTTPLPVTTAAPTTVDPCVDTDSRCATDFQYAFTICSDSINYTRCRKTCRVCSPAATAPTTPTVTTTPLPVTTAAPTTVDLCVDTDSRCATDFQYAFTICSDSINYTRCRKTCRVCSPVATAPTTPTVTTTPLPVTTAAPTTVDPCVDTDSRCATDFQYAFTICSDSINYTRCRKTCRVCSPAATAPTTPTVTTTPLPVTTAAPTTVDPCVDTDSRCATDFQYAFTICSDSINYTRCRKTCRVCSPVATAPTTPTVTTTPLPVTTAAPTTVGPCVDTDSRCATDFQYAFTICNDSINYTRCRKTCKAC